MCLVWHSALSQDTPHSMSLFPSTTHSHFPLKGRKAPDQPDGCSSQTPQPPWNIQPWSTFFMIVLKYEGNKKTPVYRLSYLKPLSSCGCTVFPSLFLHSNQVDMKTFGNYLQNMPINFHFSSAVVTFCLDYTFLPLGRGFRSALKNLYFSIKFAVQ